MIPRIQTGTSFMGAGLYYLHDKKQDGERERLTTDRVAWTHSLNTLEDDPQAVLAEMRQTALDQGMLKHLAGNRGDGRPTERTVLTVALAWSPEQSIDRPQMIEAGLSFLEHMGWQEHQVLFVAHNDTAHPHVHLIINRVHPESGMTLDDTWSKRRSQQWALGYEREHGRVYCEAREAKYDRSREPEIKSMNYREWREWQALHKDKVLDPEFQQTVEAGVWAILKQSQKQERVGYWRDTNQMRKELRTGLREEVRQEFAGEWQEYAELRDERQEKLQERERDARQTIAKLRRERGPKSRASIEKVRERLDEARQKVRAELTDIRADISERQKQRLDALAVPALEQLTKDRLEQYQVLLAQHRADRAGLRDDQQQGTRRHDLLQHYTVQQSPERSVTTARTDNPRQARPSQRTARDYSLRATEVRGRDHAENIRGHGDPAQKQPRRGASDLVAGAGLAAIGKIAESLETLFDGGEQKAEKGQVMAQEDDVPKQPVNPPKPQSESLEEERRKQNLEFYLQQRDRERHNDRGR
jgi:hypothetical protein